jgi:cystathionine gamma-lyase
VKFETRAIHAGQTPDPTSGAIMTPITLASTFVQEAPGQYKKYDYARAGNPTRTAYEECLASLEGGKFGFALSSGCAATTTVLHLLSAGDHVVAGDDLYGGTGRLFNKVFQQLGLEFTYVDLTEAGNLEKALRPNTKLLWLETPTNPTLKICDIRKLAAAARARGIMTVVDNTFMSPYFQRPLELGADIVMHSTTKYIGGHSDLIGGALVTNSNDLAEKLAFLLKSIGAVASPFDCYLGLRSLKTLPVRMRAHEQNARAICEFLEKHPSVEKVIYPGSVKHPQHALAKEQMKGFGGMISIYVRGGLEKAISIVKKVKVFALAESLGGVESLIEHPAIMTHASVPSERREKLGIGDNFLRLSVGLEHIDDLIADLENALR